MQTRNQDVIKALIELLAIAKVAMPDFLYDIDPRVQAALRLLAEIEHPSHSRPPDLRREPPIEMVDITPPPSPGACCATHTLGHIRGLGRVHG